MGSDQEKAATELVKHLARNAAKMDFERAIMIRSMSALAGDTAANISILEEKIPIPDLIRLVQEMAKDSDTTKLTVKASFYPFEVLSDAANVLGNRLTVVF